MARRNPKASKKELEGEKTSKDYQRGQESTTPETPPSDQVNTISQPPVVDPDRAPVEGEDNVGFKMKGGRHPELANDDPNAVERPEDRIWGIASRARWGENNDDATKLHAESREIDRQIAEQEAGKE